MSLFDTIKYYKKLLKHAGFTYKCPYCNYWARDMEMVGHDLPVLTEKQVIGGGRRAAGCRKCKSRDRERLLYAFLFKELKIHLKKSHQILHIAPEPRLSSLLVQQDFENYICGDLFTEGYHYPDHVRNMNVLDLQFDAGTFDLVICNHVLEHIPQDTKALAEIYRVLKPGGKAILQVPVSRNSEQTDEDFTLSDPKERERRFGQFDHVRLYGQDYEVRLQSAGFQVDRINISKKYRKYAVNPHEEIFYCQK